MALEVAMRVLVTVKAYPGLSTRRGETVCVAGVRVDTEVPEWVRLYPVAFRDLPKTEQFKKYQLVDLRARKSSDPRPESYSPNLSSLILGDVVTTGSDRQWQARWRLLETLAGATTTCELIRAQSQPRPRPSLGLVKPNVLDAVVEPNAGFDADKAELARIAAAENLFGAAKSVLEPPPFKVVYHYRCAGESACSGHHSTLIDWEAGGRALLARRWSVGRGGATLAPQAVPRRPVWRRPGHVLLRRQPVQRPARVLGAGSVLAAARQPASERPVLSVRYGKGGHPLAKLVAHDVTVTVRRVPLEAQQRDARLGGQFGDLFQRGDTLRRTEQCAEARSAPRVTGTKQRAVLLRVPESRQVYVRDAGFRERVGEPSFRQAGLARERSQPYVDQDRDLVVP